jgi:aspartate carbamoyltransferase catalytic subunit
MKHLISIKDLTKDEIMSILILAKEIEESPQNFAEDMKGKIMSVLFYEPSTRTRLSFESAFLKMGGNVLGFADASATSAKKGESIADTIMMAAAYSDIIVMRHFLEGSGAVGAEYSSVPLISGGTGIQEHPTQALLDAYTIWKEFGRLDNLTLGLVGDLRYGRTIPSLLYTLSKFENNKVYLFSPPQLKVRMSILNDIEGLINYTEAQKLPDDISDLDVLYVTRVQKERFPDEQTYERVKDFYVIDEETVKSGKNELIVMHPLPRVNEIAYEVDKLPQARYFQQAKNGVWTRMAILKKMVV